MYKVLNISDTNKRWFVELPEMRYFRKVEPHTFVLLAFLKTDNTISAANKICKQIHNCEFVQRKKLIPIPSFSNRMGTCCTKRFVGPVFSLVPNPAFPINDSYQISIFLGMPTCRRRDVPQMCMRPVLVWHDNLRQ